MKKTLTIVTICALLLPLLAVAKKGNKTQVAQNLNIFNSIYKELESWYVDTLDSDKNIRNAIDYMLSQIDPYTEYYPLQEQEALTQISTGEFSGIGCLISSRNGQVLMSKPEWGSPSRNAGVKHGDILLAIDGDTLAPNIALSDVTKRLRGQGGTHVRVTVQRPYATDSILDIDITRGTIRTNPVPYYGMLRDGVGYINLTTFSEQSGPKVKEALQALKKNPELKSIVLDLRDNGGGLLESAVQIVGFFVPKGTEVLRTRFRDPDNEKIYKTTQSPIDTNIPLAVLINDGTASSAEIVSGALQDLDRAVIIGERSYGKGLVQNTRPLPFDGVLKLTVARYYIPSGRLIQALDYSHRNPDGSPARVPDSLTNVFHTVVGREVRDGGGITPDVKIEHADINRLIYNIITQDWAYNYATRYSALEQNRMPAAADFAITDSIYDDFKAFIDPEKFQYDRAYETSLNMLRDAAKAEGYLTDSVAAQFDILEGMLKQDLNRELDFNKEQLSKVLDTEISQRFYSDGECVMREITYDDPDVDAAIEILTTPSRYREILSPKPQQ